MSLLALPPFIPVSVKHQTSYSEVSNHIRWTTGKPKTRTKLSPLCLAAEAPMFCPCRPHRPHFLALPALLTLLQTSWSLICSGVTSGSALLLAFACSRTVSVQGAPSHPPGPGSAVAFLERPASSPSSACHLQDGSLQFPHLCGALTGLPPESLSGQHAPQRPVTLRGLFCAL